MNGCKITLENFHLPEGKEIHNIGHQMWGNAVSDAHTLTSLPAFSSVGIICNIRGYINNHPRYELDTLSADIARREYNVPRIGQRDPSADRTQTGRC